MSDHEPLSEAYTVLIGIRGLTASASSGLFDWCILINCTLYLSLT